MATEWPFPHDREWIARRRRPGRRRLQAVFGLLVGLATIGSFVLGDAVLVRCTLEDEGKLWATLTNGSFVPAGLLSAEVGGAEAPPCN
jgi:hypothetical protein